MKSSKMKMSNKNCSTSSRQMIETDCFGHFSSNCRRNATSGLVIYFLLLQSIPVRAIEIEKASAYRYQGPVVQGGVNAKPVNEIQEETTRLKDLPRFTQPIENSSTPLGRDALLDCFVDNAENFMIAWLRVDTQTILSMGEIIISRNHRVSVTSSTDKKHWRLTIRDVRPTDQGWYMCQISTDPMLSQMGHLEVTEPARFIDSETSGDVEAKEGQRVRLKCAATGHPIPTIRWKREDKKPITNGKIQGNEIEFERVARTDLGAYLCIAANGIPPAISRRISLSVLYPPQIHLHVQVAKAPIGERVHLNCTARGNPTPNVTWYRGTEKVFSDGMKHDLNHDLREKSVFSSLSILYVDRKDDLVPYTCEGNNSEGSTRDTLNIEVLEKISYDIQQQFAETHLKLRNPEEDDSRSVTQRHDDNERRRLIQQQNEAKRLTQDGFEYVSGRRNGSGHLNNNNNNGHGDGIGGIWTNSVYNGGSSVRFRAFSRLLSLMMTLVKIFV